MSGLMSLALFLGVALALLAGFPVAFTLAGVALIFAGIGVMTGTFDPVFLEAFPNRVFGIMTNETLIAVPVFVFMGVMLERSKLADQLLQSLAQLMRRVPGGLGIAVMVVGTLMAASTGIVGATVVTMGLLSLPTMLSAVPPSVERRRARGPGSEGSRANVSTAAGSVPGRDDRSITLHCWRAALSTVSVSSTVTWWVSWAPIAL